MNITEFAEQIVFGTTLEAKLAAPGRLTIDTNRRQPMTSIKAPGRPYGLEMQSPGNSSLTRPSDDNLENESERGKLLHFLANHELLATELMALVLLKFPDAPHAFRRGVLVTLQEEQAHTQMYIDRMRDCGLEFGTYPVSGQFWQIIEPMQSPMDFVSRLSLTFEQANLDYSKHFAKVFARIGDQATANVLQQIYEDEIGHVQHGLHWFRQWKDPDKSDWQAYEDALDFPMSPQRARAPKIAFNRLGREQAGLDRGFIDTVEVFQKSRGRATSVRWFDAGAENELSSMRDDKTDWLIGRLNNDLQLAMLPLAKPDDILLVDQIPSQRLRKQLTDSGFQLPEFVLKQDRQQLLDRKLHDCSPWAWTPASQLIESQLRPALKHVSGTWQNETFDLYRKSWSADVLASAISNAGTATNPTPDFFCDANVIGQTVSSIGQFESARSEFKDRGFSHLIFKSELSTSGRGQRRFPTTGQLPEHDSNWLQSSLQLSDRNLDDQTGNHGEHCLAIVEPELDRTLDFSMLWNKSRLGEETATYLGWSQQIIGSGRRYVGSQLDKSLHGCDAETRRFFLEQKCARVNRTVDWVQRMIEPKLQALGFAGLFGVDAFVFRDRDGELKIKPIVELNPRHTMGHVSLALAKHLAGGIPGQFRIFTTAQWKEFMAEASDVPVTLSKQGHWQAGVIPFGEIGQQTKMIPAVLVGGKVLRLDEKPTRDQNQ
jgi:uncharacterized ferritin-like protein (DUF455 family)